MCDSASTTAAAPASEVEDIVRSQTNMAATKIVAVDFNNMTSKLHHSTACLLATMFVGEDLLANRQLQMLLLFRLTVRSLESIYYKSVASTKASLCN